MPATPSKLRPKWVLGTSKVKKGWGHLPLAAPRLLGALPFVIRGPPHVEALTALDPINRLSNPEEQAKSHASLGESILPLRFSGRFPMNCFWRTLSILASLVTGLLVSAGPAAAADVHCSALRPFNGSPRDASSTLLNCIHQTSPGGTLSLPGGRYVLSSQINISSPIHIRTAGLPKTAPRCSDLAAGRCAEFQAMAGFTPPSEGFFVASGDGVHIDHIVVDGNRLARLTSKAAASCQDATTNQLGVNIIWGSNSSSFTNSSSRNTVCGSALEVTARSAVVIENNTFASNGFHNRKFLWSDGITVWDAASSVFRGNFIVDSTDVDLIFGGCQSCQITGNTITHNGSYAGSAFAAIVVHAWPNGETSGNYTGSEFSENLVDCGINRSCGFGCHDWRGRMV